MAIDPQHVQKLFLKIAELPIGDRVAALDLESGGDAALRGRIEALLKAHDEPGSLLDHSEGHIEVTVLSGLGEGAKDPIALSPEDNGGLEQIPTAEYRLKIEAGTVIGDRYRLQEKIGEGGMGEVWVAKQTEPVKRKVALKLIKTGMDSKAVMQRFEQERQALAMMDHPNIARVLDGGTTSNGQPYFVMELVNGLPLTRFCDDAKLTPKQRLELFVPICHAVQHSHQKGIVHRDLKPANILVTLTDGQPVPKVIDFGVAKATGGKLTENTLSTQFGAVMGTLEYMSPEQAGFSSLDVDTRADIYSLGVILYELLTGLRPIDAQRLKKAAFAEMIRIISEEEPSKPSTRLSTDALLPSLAALRQTDPHKLMALLRGELDWVVMKCLAKSRDRRYETADALSRDIQRYLANEPVEARPPSATYCIGKFLKRNKGPVVAASLVLLALVAGIVGTSLGLIRARAAERLAQARYDDAEVQRNRATKMAVRESEQREVAVNRQIEAERERKRADQNLRTAREAVDRLLTRAAEDLRGIPQIERVRKSLLEDALVFYQGFLKEKSKDPAIRRETGLAAVRIGHIRSFLGQLNDGAASYREAIEIFTQLTKEQPGESDFREQLAEAYLRFATVEMQLHHFDSGTAAFERSIQMWDELAKDWPNRPQYLQNSATANLELAFNWGGRYWFSKAAPHMERKNQLLIEIARRFPTFAIDPKLFANAGVAIPVDQANPDQKDLIGAPLGRDYATLPHDPQVLKKYEEELRRTMAYWEPLVVAHPDAPAYQQTFLIASGMLMKVLGAQNRIDEVELLFNRNEKEFAPLFLRFPERVEYQVSQAWSDYLRGNLHYMFHRNAEARESFRKAISMMKTLIERFPNERRYRSHLLGMLIYCPVAALREPQRAVVEARRSIELNEADAEWAELAYAQTLAGQHAEALQSIEKARTRPMKEPKLQQVESIVRLNLGQHEEAQRLYKQMAQTIDQTPNKAWYTPQYRFFRAEYDEKMGMKPFLIQTTAPK